MKLVAIRLDENMIEHIKNVSKNINDNSLQETYRKLITLGLQVINGSKINSDKLLMSATQDNIEMKHYIKLIYQKLFDDNANELFSSTKSNAKELVNKIAEVN